MSEILDIQEILKYLPHRYPFLLIDRVVGMDEDGRKLHAIKNVTMNEPFFTGHFPGNPVMPGVLILESLAQACVMLANYMDKKLMSDLTEGVHLLAGVENARFRKMVTPGDQLHLHVELLKFRQGIWKLRGEARVNDEVVCDANFTSATKGA